MTFTIEIPLIGAMFLEVAGDWEPATPLENDEPCDAAEITGIADMRIVVRGKPGLGLVHHEKEMSVHSLIMMEPDSELNERLIDALEDRGGY